MSSLYIIYISYHTGTVLMKECTSFLYIKGKKFCSAGDECLIVSQVSYSFCLALDCFKAKVFNYLSNQILALSHCS
jgi:hypothetical protein